MPKRGVNVLMKRRVEKCNGTLRGEGKREARSRESQPILHGSILHAAMHFSRGSYYLN